MGIATKARTRSRHAATPRRCVRVSAARKITQRDDLTLHDMRHSAASLAGMTGATTAELKAMMGHATAGMVERYQHANKTAAPDSLRT